MTVEGVALKTSKAVAGANAHWRDFRYCWASTPVVLSHR